MKVRSSSYYVKLVLYCFAITSIPVVVLGFLSYSHSSQVVQRSVNTQKSLSLTQMQANVEQLLNAVDQSATHFLSSYVVQSALYEPLNPKQFTLFNQLKSELNYLQRVDNGITDITMLSTAGEWLINNNGLYRLADVKDPPLHLMADSEDASYYTVSVGGGDSSSSAPEAASSPGGCTNKIQLVKKLPLTAFNPVGLAVITIPACSLSDNVSLDSEQEAFLILDERQAVVWSQGMEVPDLEAVRGRLKAAEEPQGQVSLPMKDERYTVTYRKSDYTGWTYMSVVSVAQLAKQSRGIGWFTFYICLALLLLFVGLSWVLSMRMYRPIFTLYREVVGVKEGPSPGTRVDELAAIGEQVRTMFRTERELQNRLQGQMEQLKTFFMIRLVLGGMKDEEIIANLHQFELGHDFKRFAVLAAQIDLEGTRFGPKDYDLLMFAVNNMIEELIPASERLVPVLLGRSQITVVTSSGGQEEEFRKSLYALAEQVQTAVADYLGIPVYIGVSLDYGRLRDIPRAYEESVEALQARVRFGGQSILSFADLGENHAMHYSYPFELQKELFDAMKVADRRRTELLLQQMMAEICSSSAYPQDQQYNAVRLLMNVMNLAHSFDLQAPLMDNQQTLFDELFRLDIPKEGERWIREKLIGPILDGIEERTELRHLNISRELIQIVQNEFETDLSIESVADRLHYSPSYLSTVFRKSMNVPFSAYLAQYRHQTALRWLVETDMSVKEISERLRYNNPQNFIRSFRKLEGLPPGKYRELHANGGSADREEEGQGA